VENSKRSSVRALPGALAIYMEIKERARKNEGEKKM